MEPKKVNAKIVLGLMSTMVIESFVLLLLMNPAFKSHNFLWVGLDVLLIVATTILMSRYTKSITGEKGPIDLKLKKLNGSWWYGKLGPIWVAIHISIYFLLIPYLILDGWSWRIGIATEAVITFALMLYCMKLIAKVDPPKNKEMQLWTTFMMFGIFMVLTLNRPTPTHDINRVFEESHAFMNRTIILNFSVMAIWFCFGIAPLAFKSIRTAQALMKNAPTEPKIVP